MKRCNIAIASSDGTARVWRSSIFQNPDVKAVVIIFAVVNPLFLLFCLHYVVWKICNFGSTHPNKCKCALFLVFVHSWSPDGTMIATSHDDTPQNHNTASVWSSSSGIMLLTLTGHGVSVKSVAWSPDGTKIATASDMRFGGVCIWIISSRTRS
jgi:WD40 repeat protein